MSILFQRAVCLFVFFIMVFLYLEKQNTLTSLRLQIPEITKEVHLLHEEISRLEYEVDHFESPDHLMELAGRPEYDHLKHPLVKDILTVFEELIARY